MIQVGQVYPTNGGGDVVVIGFTSSKSITVEFMDEHKYRKTVTSSDLYSGKIKNLYYPLVCGVGYIGVGIYNTKSRGSEAYKVWRNMLDRCYKSVGKNPTYVGCVVHPTWFNFQVFAEWFYESSNYVAGLCLDKDIIVKGNKEYCPSRCSFVPREVNNLITNRKAARGDCPIGVTYDTTNNRFIAQCRDGDGGIIWLGRHSTAEVAWEHYKIAKERSLRKAANKFKHLLAPDVYESLINWEVEYND